MIYKDEIREVEPKESLIDTVRMLIEARERGENVFCEYDGKILRSESVTYETAKEEMLKDLDDKIDEVELDPEGEIEFAMSRINEWINRGKRVLPKEKWALLEERINDAPSELSHGVWTENAMEIIEALAAGISTTSAIHMLKKQKNDEIVPDSKGEDFVASIVYDLSPKGPDFFGALHCGKKMEVKGSLDDVVNRLIEARDRGENLYCIFNGVLLMSSSVTMNDAFVQVTGHTKEELEQQEREYREQYKQEQREKKEIAIKRIPEWESRGKRIISQEKFDRWKAVVAKRAVEIYHGVELDDALEVMEALATGIDINSAVVMFNKYTKNNVAKQQIFNIIVTFSNRGAEFFETVTDLPKMKCSDSLEETVNRLIEARRNGKSCYTIYENVVLLSNTVTMDGAFKEITGFTKEEYEKDKLERAELLRKQKEKEKEIALGRIPEWINRGKRIISREKHQQWEECVTERAKDKTNGADIDLALKIMEALESGMPVESSVQMLRKARGNFYIFPMVLRMVRVFSNHGIEFWKANNTSYKEVSPSDTLDRTVENLIAARGRKERLFCVFNDTILISDVVTMDNAYLQVYGMTKAEFDRKRREDIEREEREYLEAQKGDIAKIPEWLEKGKELIYPEKYKDWMACVNYCVNTCHEGFVLDCALEIMEALNGDATVEEAFEMLKEQDKTVHSGSSLALTRKILLNFAKFGPELYKWSAIEKIPAEDLVYVNAVAQMNRELAEKHKNDIVRAK